MQNILSIKILFLNCSKAIKLEIITVARFNKLMSSEEPSFLEWSYPKSTLDGSSLDPSSCGQQYTIKSMWQGLTRPLVRLV